MRGLNKVWGIVHCHFITFVTSGKKINQFPSSLERHVLRIKSFIAVYFSQ